MPPRISRLDRIIQASQPLTQPIPLRPPMTGWNTRDDFDGMEPTDAVQMDNWYADAGGLNTRKGTQPWCAGMGGPVNTVAEYYTGTIRKLIAMAAGNIYDASSSTPATLAGGFHDSAWSTQNFSGKLFMANRSPGDAVQALTGSTVVNAGFTGPPTHPIGVFLFKTRLYFWCANSPVFWYAGLAAVTGALSAFDISQVAQHGGNILCLTNFSHDGGDGVTNMFAIVMTTGEIILYLGSDPGLTSDWQLAGKYKLAAPIDARSVAAYGGDVYLTTLDDHVALQEQLTALKVGQTPPRSKISGAVRDALVANPTGFGYQALYYGRGRRVEFNVPNVDGTYDQHIYNTSNQSWQRFQGRNGISWCEYNANLMFGRADGSVWQADIGTTDNGASIACTAQQAWSALSIPTSKRLAGARPIVSVVQNQRYTFSVGYDYKPVVVQISPPGLTAYPLWDVTRWDTSLWTADQVPVDLAVHAAAGTGTVISFALSCSALTALTWMRTDLVIEAAKQI